MDIVFNPDTYQPRRPLSAALIQEGILFHGELEEALAAELRGTPTAAGPMPSETAEAAAGAPTAEGVRIDSAHAVPAPADANDAATPVSPSSRRTPCRMSFGPPTSR